MDLVAISIILFSVWGCGMSCYHLGQKYGIEKSVQYLIDQGMIDAESD